MSNLDAPDFESIVTTVLTTGAVPDAPDFQSIVVGPGGVPVGGASGGSFLTPYANAGFLGVTLDQSGVTGNTGLLSPQTTLMAFAAAFTGPVHNVFLNITTGATFTSTKTYAGIYDFGQTTPGKFTLLATSASGVAASVWLGTGTNPVSMTTNPVLTAGQTYAVAIMNDGATVTCWGQTLSGGHAFPTYSVNPWWGNTGGSATALPTTILFSGVTSPARIYQAFVN